MFNKHKANLHSMRLRITNTIHTHPIDKTLKSNINRYFFLAPPEVFFVAFTVVECEDMLAPDFVLWSLSVDYWDWWEGLLLVWRRLVLKLVGRGLILVDLILILVLGLGLRLVELWLLFGGGLVG